MRLTLSGVMNIIQLLATLPAMLALDKLGRRPWLIVGSVGMAISHFIVAAMIGELPQLSLLNVATAGLPFTPVRQILLRLAKELISSLGGRGIHLCLHVSLRRWLGSDSLGYAG